jgi:ribosomal protein S18 acetylase RimI-like enzyme
LIPPAAAGNFIVGKERNSGPKQGMEWASPWLTTAILDRRKGMSVTYFKRFRMEIDLERVPQTPELPQGCYWVPWRRQIMEFHAQVKYRCFADELDATIFPCLGDRDGCQRLMQDISSRRGFIPEATWLVGSPTGYIGTVQGVVDRAAMGMIQNLGVIPEARSQGIGGALLIRALHGFKEAGLRRGMLEVTAQNTVAVRLYRRIGFRKARTVYKAVEAPE